MKNYRNEEKISLTEMKKVSLTEMKKKYDSTVVMKKKLTKFQTFWTVYYVSLSSINIQCIDHSADSVSEI